MNPFTKVTVTPDYGNNSAGIEWEINKPAYEGAEFFIRKSPDGERNIQVIQQSLGEDVREFTDKRCYLRGRTARIFYQIIMRHSGVAYHSTFVEASGRKIHVTEQTRKVDEHQPEEDAEIKQEDEVLEVQERVQPEEVEAPKLEPLRREVGILRQINKLEELNMRHSGNPCIVLKPKQSGELSHKGIDQDTKQDQNVFGEGRFGKMYEGGYEEPIYTYMLGLQKRSDVVVSVQTGEGQVDKYAYAIRMLASPRIAHDDIIIDTDADIRYAVKQVDRHQFKGVHDVVQMVMAVAVDKSSVIYQYQLPEKV